MKILIAGNLANVGFEIVKAMRSKNIDANLLMPKNSHRSSDPKSLYPNLEKTGYPNWVITYDNNKRGFGLSNWKLQVIKEMRNNYDCIIALTEFSIFAMLSGKPYGALSTGSDMRELAFEKSLKGFLYRLSYKFARIIIWGEPDKLHLIKKLDLERKAVFSTSPRNNNFQIQKKSKGDLEGKVIIFYPTSQHWRLKGNDLFLKAFEKLCSDIKNVHLIISERGPDLEKSKKILENGNAKNNFKFIPVLDADQMKYYFNLCDIVVDQFSIGSMGMITMEAMNYAKPVILQLNKKYFQECYNNPPDSLTNCETSEQIYKEMKKLVLNPKLCQEVGIQNKKWVDENWNNSKLTERYIKICNAIATNNIRIIESPLKL